MPDDRLRQIFEQIAEQPVDVPPADRVLARGRQRHGLARLQISAIAATILLAAGFGAPQMSGSLATSRQLTGGVLPKASSPLALHTDIKAARASASSAPRSTTTSKPASHSSASPSPLPRDLTSLGPASPLLPPAGDGQLILGLDSAHRYVMTRVGSASAPVQVPRLAAVAGAPPVLATNPAGGWVVTLASHEPGMRVAPARLALVKATGRSVPFGPKFIHATVTSAAVSLDGSRVAVALAGQSGQARIEVQPLPGHPGTRRSWSVPTLQADLVTGLSWAPDGHHLSYIAGQRSVIGTAGSPVTMDTAVSVQAAQAITHWPLAMNTGMTCVPVAMAWLGRTGRYVVLEECASTGTVVLRTADASTGAAARQPVVVAHHVGCGQAALDPNASGSRILISYCGIYLDDHGKLTRAPGRITAAALSG
jgi:hypothetical protein